MHAAFATASLPRAVLAAFLAAGAWAGAAPPAFGQGSVKPPPPEAAAPPQAGANAAPSGRMGGAPAEAPAGPVAAIELAPGISFEVVELRRMPDRNVMQLRFAVANRSTADTSLKDHGLTFNTQLRDIHIVDFGGRRQYSIGSAARCLCSTFRESDGGVVRAGERREFWAWYGLPPAGARQMAIQIPDHPPITGVPLL